MSTAQHSVTSVSVHSFSPDIADQHERRGSSGLPDNSELEREIAQAFPEYELTPEDEAAMYRDYCARIIFRTYCRSINRARRMRRWVAWVNIPGDAATYEAGAHKKKDDAIAAADKLALELAYDAFDASTPPDMLDVPCRGCGVAIYSPDDADPICKRCQAAEVAA